MQQRSNGIQALLGSILLALGLLAAGCSDATAPAPSSEASGASSETRSQTIKGGTIDYQSTAVMGLLIQKSGGVGICSGTLIAPNLILTARHCVMSSGTRRGRCGSRTFTGKISPRNVRATTKAEDIQRSRQFRDVSKIHVPQNQTPVCGHDIALVQLQKNVPSSKASPRPPRVTSAVRARTSYTAIGYGVTGDGTGSGTRRRLSGLRVRCVGTNCGSPDRVAKKEFAGSGGVCQGDSGGGAYLSSKKVIGIAARADRDCRTSIYTRVYPWRQWIQNVAQQAARDGNYSVPSWTNVQDDDGDGIPNRDDNCPNASNPGQKDMDGDGRGDKCDADVDGDGVKDRNDNCPETSNPNQNDLDGDGNGDACDDDIDADGVRNPSDLCPTLKNPKQRTSGPNDTCENSDGDAWANAGDNCPETTNSMQKDSDNDGVGDACESDSDSDDPSDVDAGGDSPDAAMGGPDTGTNETSQDGGPSIKRVPQNGGTEASPCSIGGSVNPLGPFGWVMGVMVALGLFRRRTRD